MTPPSASVNTSGSFSNGITGTDEQSLNFDSILDCIEAFKHGQFLIVLDSPSRENEGDLIISAAALTPSTCAFMVRHTSGYLCAPLTPERATDLGLKRMVAEDDNEDPNGTAYCISVDAAQKWGTTTGISALERAATCNLLAGVAPAERVGWEGVRVEVEKGDFRRPGHVLPLLAKAGGVRQRRGHTEAGVEFARLVGLEPAVAVIGELIEEGDGKEEERAMRGEDGRPGYVTHGMMRAEACLRFGRKWGIKVCTIEDLVEYVETKEGKLQR